MAEARRQQRISPLIILAEYHFGETVGEGYVTNLSEAGAFLAVETTIPFGEPVFLRLTMPWHLGVLEVKAEVKWRTEDMPNTSKTAGHPMGVGLAFMNLAAEDQEIVRRYMIKFCSLAEQIQK